MTGYLTYQYKKLRTVDGEIDISAERLRNYPILDKEFVIKENESGYIVQHVLIEARERITCFGEYNHVLDMLSYIDHGDGSSSIRRVRPDGERTEELYVKQFKDTQKEINVYHKNNTKCFVVKSDGRYVFGGSCYTDVSKYIVLGEKTFGTLKEATSYLRDKDYIENIVSFEFEIVKSDDKFQYPSYIENYLGLYTGKDVASVREEIQRREASFKKLYCADLLEIEKTHIFARCVKEMLFFYLGLKYLIDQNENFRISMDERSRIEKFVKSNYLLDNEGIIKNTIAFIKTMDERFNENNVEKSLRDIKVKLDYAKPVTETEPINIEWHYRKVLPLIEEICIKNSIDEIPPFGKKLERGTRYIGVVTEIERYCFRVDLIVKNANHRIIQLGENRFNHHCYDSEDSRCFDEIEGIKEKCDDLPTRGFVHISKIRNEYVKDIRRYVGTNEYVELYYLYFGRQSGSHEFTMIKPT